MNFMEKRTDYQFYKKWIIVWNKLQAQKKLSDLFQFNLKL